MHSNISRLLPKAIFLSGALFIGWAANAQSTSTQPQSDTSHTRAFRKFPTAKAPDYLRHDNNWTFHGKGANGKFGGDRGGIRYTPDQRKQMAAINKEYRQQSEELFKKDNLTLKEYKAGLRSLQTERKTKLDGLLTQQQKDQRAAHTKKMSENMQVMAAARLERMKLQLDLTDDQVAKIRSGEEGFRSQLKTLHQNDNLLPQEKREQVRDLASKHRDLVKSVLTPEQQAKFEQMMHRRSGEGRHGGFRGRGPGYRAGFDGGVSQPI